MAKIKLTRGRIFRIRGRNEYFMFLKQRGSQYADALVMEYSKEQSKFIFKEIEEKLPRKKAYIPKELPGNENEFLKLYKL